MSERFSGFKTPIVVRKKRFRALAWQLVQDMTCSDISMATVRSLLDCLGSLTKFSCRIISDEGHEWTWKFKDCSDELSESDKELWNRWVPTKYNIQ